MTCDEILAQYGHEPGKKSQDGNWYHSFINPPDHTPSFHTSSDGQVWYDFSSKQGGGPAQLIAILEGTSHQEAQVIYDKMRGVEIDLPKGRVLLDEIVKSLQVPGHDYLRGRGIPDEVVTRYGIGYCQDYQTDVLDKFNIDPEYAKSIGLFDISGMIVYPYRDVYGTFKIHGRTTQNKQYMSGVSEYGRKSLWGLGEVRPPDVWLFEGYHDVLVASANGIPAVALSGTNMFQEYWDELWDHGFRRLIFCPDGDPGGQGLLSRLAKSPDTRFTIEVVTLPSGDPDDAIMEGRLSGYERKHLVQWYVDNTYPGQLGLADKIVMFKDLAPLITSFPPVERETIKQYFKDRFGDDGAIDYLEYTPPPDPKLERVVLANSLAGIDARYYAMENLGRDDFSIRSHSLVFDILSDSDSNLEFVQNTLDMDLSRDIDLPNHEKYVDKLKSLSVSRQFKSVLERYAGRMDDPARAAVEITDRFLEMSSTSVRVLPASMVIQDFVAELKDRAENGITGIQLPDRFELLNASMHGLVPGKLILVSGMTGHKKTMLANNLVDGICYERDARVLFFTMEMSAVELMERQMIIHTGIASGKILSGNLTDRELDDINKAGMLLHDKLNFVAGVYDLPKILAISKAQISRGVRVVVIDYAQLMQIPGYGETWERLSRMTKTLKSELCSLGVTVVLISQLSFQKDAEDLDIRMQAGAKAMANDADVGLAIRTIPPDKIKDGVNFTIKISKHRYGRDGVTIPCVFDAGNLRISEKR